MNTAGKRYCRGIVGNALCVALCMALYAAVPMAQAQTVAATESVRQYEIPAGPLSTALSAWGAQSDRQLVFAPGLIAGKQGRGIYGRYGAEQALTQLLAGTGLAWERVDGQTYTLKQAPLPTDAERARIVIGDFTRLAWRRPITPAELDELMQLYASAVAEGESFPAGVKFALKAVLVSPYFLFRGEQAAPASPLSPLAQH